MISPSINHCNYSTSCYYQDWLSLSLASSLNSLGPAADILVSLLARSTRSLGHDLSSFRLGQVCLGEAAGRLLLRLYSKSGTEGNAGGDSKDELRGPCSYPTEESWQRHLPALEDHDFAELAAGDLADLTHKN